MIDVGDQDAGAVSGRIGLRSRPIRPDQKFGSFDRSANLTQINGFNGTSIKPIKLYTICHGPPNQSFCARRLRVRFDRLPALQQKYLRAMAELGEGPFTTGLIAATLGVEPSAVATVRQQLINKGMVWSQRHGETAFTVPMFDAFMRRQMPQLEKHIPKRRPMKS